MKRRFTINEQGVLVDRQGHELGRVVGITIESSEGVGGLVKEAVVKDELLNPLPPSEPGDVCPFCRNGKLEAAGSLLVCPTCGQNLINVPVQRRLGEDGEPVPLLSPAGEVESVWEHYVEVMAPRNKKLDPAARTLIRDALKLATALECKLAIDGCRASAFHMGSNDRGKKYNRLSQILKGKRGIRTTREQIDLFLDIAEKHPGGASVSSVDASRLAEAKRNVLTAWDMPRSRQAQEMARMSAAWLAQHGYRVEPDPDTGRPTFVMEGS